MAAAVVALQIMQISIKGQRGLGAELSWLAPTPWYLELNASAMQADLACCSRSFYGGQSPGTDGPEDLLYTLGLKQFFDLDDDRAWGLQWGLWAQFGPNPTGYGNRTELYGTDIYLRWRPPGDADRMAVSLTVEGILRAAQIPSGTLLDGGAYAQLVWEMADWEAGARYDWTLGVADDWLDPGQTGNRHRVTVQGTWKPSHFSRVRLQAGWDAPAWREAPIWSVALGLEVLIGAHGTHAY